jgi:hypothetical protein
MSTRVLSAMTVLLLSACATSPAPTATHRWIIGYKTNHIPMQGLVARPRTTADERPALLVNFADEAKRDADRQSEIARGAAFGAGATALEALSQFGAPSVPLCALVPPLCVGVVAAGGALGAALNAPTSVAQQDAERLAEIVKTVATNESVERWSAMRIRRVDKSRDHPSLSLRVAAVLLVPAKTGVTFRVVVEAQAFPNPDQVWEPSIHYTQLPIRPVADWLQAGGAILKSDLGLALQGLAYHAAVVYLPFEERGR